MLFQLFIKVTDLRGLGKENKMTFIAVYDWFCDKCKVIIREREVQQGDPSRLPCPKCREDMNFRGHVPMMNLKTSDLPGSGWEGPQPAFGMAHCGSKREVFKALADFNSREKDKASEAGTAFKPYEWNPTDSKMDELESMRKEQGGQSVNDYMTMEYEKQAKERTEKIVEDTLKDVEF